MSRKCVLSRQSRSDSYEIPIMRSHSLILVTFNGEKYERRNDTNAVSTGTGY